MKWISIGKIAKEYDVSTQTIRNWEAEGMFSQVLRTQGGHRRFLLEEISEETMIQTGIIPKKTKKIKPKKQNKPKKNKQKIRSKNAINSDSSGTKRTNGASLRYILSLIKRQDNILKSLN